jgi:hypothetical protein
VAGPISLTIELFPHPASRRNGFARQTGIGGTADQLVDEAPGFGSGDPLQQFFGSYVGNESSKTSIEEYESRTVEYKNAT